MNKAETALLLDQVEHKVGMVGTFYKEDPLADSLLELHEAYREMGATHTELKLFLEDLDLFLDTIKHA